MGLATPEERQEFEQLCARHPEILAARNEFEESLERAAVENAERPPVFLKEKILQAIDKDADPIKETPVVYIEQHPSRNKTMNWVAAASVILLLASAYFAYNQYAKNRELQVLTRQMQNKLDSLNDVNEQMANEQRMVSDPNVTVVSLTGTQKAPTSSAHIYWDTTSSNVYLVVKNMPRLPSNKQYQLWALIDNEPRDLGLFDIDRNRVMLKMKNVQKADAFAITIEERGNTGGPTLEELQIMGRTL